MDDTHLLIIFIFLSQKGAQLSQLYTKPTTISFKWKMKHIKAHGSRLGVFENVR